MWDTRKLLLAGIIFTVLDYKVTAESTKLLDMAQDAVDDLYVKCREEAMEKFIKSGLLTQELNQNEKFKEAWSENTNCSKQLTGGIKEHTTALSAYANGDSGFIQTFNNAVKTMGVNVSTYENSFHFKSLHFLLMDSIWLQHKLTEEKCKTVYLLLEGKHTAQVGSEVKFGQFTKGTTDYSYLLKFEDWDGKVIFNITTCFFINLGKNSCDSDSDSDLVLLSPAELFTVTYVNETYDDINEDKYIQIVLKNPKLHSWHNCYTFSRSPADVSTQWLVLVLLVFSFLA